MAFFTWLHKFLTPQRPDASPPSGREQPVSSAVDTRTEDIVAVCDLARRIALGPNGQTDDAFDRGDASALPVSDEKPDITVTVGAIFRDRGDFEQAVRLREELLSRPGTPAKLRARTLFELGRDYKQAGLLDRSLLAYADAKKAGHPERAVNEDLCRLYADSGDFASAAELARALGNVAAQACYMVRQAGEAATSGRDGAAEPLIRKALSLFPGSPEARLALCRMFLLGGSAAKALTEAKAGLGGMTKAGRLIFLEGLYSFTEGASAPDLKAESLRVLFFGLCDALAALKPDVTACYYAGLFLQAIHDNAQAEQWFTKALVLDPDFWAARLALLSLSTAWENLPPLLAGQVAFFTEAASRSKRFVCPPCGLRRDTIFSQCPRCLTWHSAAFRLRLV